MPFELGRNSQGTVLNRRHRRTHECLIGSVVNFTGHAQIPVRVEGLGGRGRGLAKNTVYSLGVESKRRQPKLHAPYDLTLSSFGEKDSGHVDLPGIGLTIPRQRAAPSKIFLTIPIVSASAAVLS